MFYELYKNIFIYLFSVKHEHGCKTSPVPRRQAQKHSDDKEANLIDSNIDAILPLSQLLYVQEAVAILSREFERGRDREERLVEVLQYCFSLQTHNTMPIRMDIKISGNKQYNFGHLWT